MLTASLLATALLFGGMVLYSFGFAAFLLNAMPAEIAGCRSPCLPRRTATCRRFWRE
ncbi:hypothetical protein [Polymorphobacter fuscus]|uniref:hypothetical protein n=1 Tax=Sandarakinorhabdus fusca TaxID=1439888 RepID=UPI00169395B2|nr:hypothetical protein [Polymorphobacter fuscus]NJC07691.1 hypothetical protein [Polymorphobacter fuscus]